MWYNFLLGRYLFGIVYSSCFLFEFDKVKDKIICSVWWRVEALDSVYGIVYMETKLNWACAKTKTCNLFGLHVDHNPFYITDQKQRMKLG